MRPPSRPSVRTWRLTEGKPVLAPRAGAPEAAGRRVNRLVQAELGPGEHTVIWNGRNAVGRDVAPGLYFYRLRGDHGTLVRKITRVR